MQDNFCWNKKTCEKIELSFKRITTRKRAKSEKFDVTDASDKLS